MKPPIIVFALDGACVFESVEEAESYVESIDVESGEYRAVFDSEGRRLRFRVEGETKRGRLGGITLVPVKLESMESVPSGLDELTESVRADLRATESASLREMIDALRSERGRRRA